MHGRARRKLKIIAFFCLHTAPFIKILKTKPKRKLCQRN